MALQEELEQQGNVLFKHRSNLPLIIVFAGLALFIYQLMTQTSCACVDYKIVEYISLNVSFLGLLIRIYAVGHTPANTSGRNTSEGQVAAELNQTGIYSTVRHPLYLGNFFMWLGTAVLINSIWFLIVFCLVYWIYYERIMYAEEQFLRKKFGEAYTGWAAKTPPFTPRFSQFVKPKYPFSWKKVVKKEKNGLFAIFLLLWIFDATYNSILAGSFVFEFNFASWGMIITGVLYFILKLLKKYTAVFHEEGR